MTPVVFVHSTVESAISPYQNQATRNIIDICRVVFSGCSQRRTSCRAKKQLTLPLAEPQFDCHLPSLAACQYALLHVRQMVQLPLSNSQIWMKHDEQVDPVTFERKLNVCKPNATLFYSLSPCPEPHTGTSRQWQVRVPIVPNTENQ